MTRRIALGRRAEHIVAGYLEDRGFQIVARNARVGRLELDLIAQRFRLFAIVEVRSRTGTRFGHPIHSIDAAKARRIRSAGYGWMRAHRRRGTVRFDAAALVFTQRGELNRLDYYESAF